MKHKIELKINTKLYLNNAIKRISDKDLLNNFVGVFPSDHMKRFINHSAMIEEKKGKYPFIIANTDDVMKKAHIGEVF